MSRTSGSCSERAERVEGRRHHAWQGITAVQRRLQGIPRRPVRRAAENRQQPPVPLEEAAQRPGNREDHVSVRHRPPNDLYEMLGEERCALGLTARAEVARLAREGDEVFRSAAAAPQAREARDVPPTVEELLDAPADHAAQHAVARRVALGVHTGVVLEVLLEQSVEARALGTTGAVEHRVLRHPRRAAAGTQPRRRCTAPAMDGPRAARGHTLCSRGTRSGHGRRG